MTTTLDYRTRKAALAGQPCRLDGCSSLRFGFAVHCRKHRRIAESYGHPQAGPLRRSSMATFRTGIAALFAKNGTHAGLIEADRWVTSLMAQATADSYAFKGANELQRLATHGVTPRAVLVEFLACSAYIDWAPSVLPEDDRCRDFALARAVFLMAPQVVKTSWTGNRRRPYRGKASVGSLAFIGRHLRVSLAEFTATVLAGLAAQTRAKAMTAEDRKAARTAPMAV